MTHPDTAGLDEYLRRNMLVCKAVGAQSIAESILKRLAATKRPPAWLVQAVTGIHDRVAPLPRDLAAYRGTWPPTERRTDTAGSGG